MPVACVGCIEIRICQPVLETESPACFFEVLGTTLENNINICVRIGFPTFAFISPAENTATFLVARAGNEVGEFAVGILRELRQIADTVKSQLIARLDAA